VQADTDHALTFNHQPSVSIPAGSYVLSDAVPMSVSDFADLAISVYVPQQMVTAPTCHGYALSTTYMVSGDATAQPEPAGAKTMTSTCFLQSVIVRNADKRAGAVVTRRWTPTIVTRTILPSGCTRSTGPRIWRC
jgi:hypothetical protein